MTWTDWFLTIGAGVLLRLVFAVIVLAALALPVIALVELVPPLGRAWRRLRGQGPPPTAPEGPGDDPALVPVGPPKGPRPAVSARSTKAEPYVLLWREKVPSSGSNAYANPPEDEPSGIAASWDAIIELIASGISS